MKAARHVMAGVASWFAAGAVAAAAANGEVVPGPSLFGSFLQMIASLILVVGVILLCSHFANKWMKNGPAARVPRYIRLIETRHLGPKKSLMLVEVGGDYLLLGNSSEGVTLIKQVDMIEEIEVVGSTDPAWSAAAARTNVLHFVGKARNLLSPLAVRREEAEKTPRFSFLRSEGGRG